VNISRCPASSNLQVLLLQTLKQAVKAGSCCPEVLRTGTVLSLTLAEFSHAATSQRHKAGSCCPEVLRFGTVLSPSLAEFSQAASSKGLAMSPASLGWILLAWHAVRQGKGTERLGLIAPLSCFRSQSHDLT
jgi:hypothetical protein